MRVSWVPSSVPIFVLLLALCGQVKEQVAVMAIAAAALALLWALALMPVVVFQLVRRSSAWPAVTGIVIAGLAILAAVALVVEAPLWVRWRAEPAIAAIEESRAEEGHYPTVASKDGDFPRPIRAALESSGSCLYKPRGASYHVSCLGVPFTKCGYDGATRSWSGWE